MTALVKLAEAVVTLSFRNSNDASSSQLQVSNILASDICIPGLQPIGFTLAKLFIPGAVLVFTVLS